MKIYLQELKWEGMAGFMWHRKRTRSELFWTQQWAFIFQEIQVISSLDQELVALQEGLCHIELVINSHYCEFCIWSTVIYIYQW